MIYAGYNTVEEIDYQLMHGMTGPKRDESYAKFVEGAYQVREAYAPKLDLMYGPADRHRLDFFPATSDPASCPTVIFFHGGGWRLSDKFFANFWAEAFCPHGYNFIAATYGFLPLYTLDQIIDHARLAVTWVHGNADKLGIDPTRLIISGNSAGAHLALMAMVQDWSTSPVELSHILATFGFSGLYDVETSYHSSKGKDFIPTIEDARKWSPHHHVKPGLPPGMFFYGDDETPEFARQTTIMHEAWKEAGNDSTLVSVPEGNHYNSQWFGRTKGHETNTALMEFLAKACAK
jgi:arylformamidase